MARVPLPFRPATTRSTGSSVSPPLHAEQIGILRDPGHLEGRNDERRQTVGGHDQHGQPLEGHGRIANEPRQIRTDREQGGVDTIRTQGVANSIQAAPENLCIVHAPDATGATRNDSDDPFLRTR